MAPKKACSQLPAGISAKEQFWRSLNAEDAKLAKAFDVATMADLNARKEKKKADEEKAKYNQQRTMWRNEEKQRWEKEQAKKQRDKANEERKWAAQLEEIKKRASKEMVLEAWYDESDGKSWVQLSSSLWKEVQGEFFCTLCEKCPNGAALESHLNSEAHKKKLAWAQGGGYTAAADTLAVPVVPLAIVPAADLPPWQQLSPDGVLRCIPCGKVVDDNHLMTADHSKRLAAFLEQERLKETGYAAPELEYLAWVPCDPADPNSEKWMKCLLCSKWVQDDTSHSGTPTVPAGSKEHAKNLRNYQWYRPNVLQERQKYHPTGPAAKAPAKAKAPPPPPPTPQARPSPSCFQALSSFPDAEEEEEEVEEC